METGKAIAFSVGTEAEYAEIVDVLAGTFLQSDPLALGAGLTAAELAAIFRLLAGHVLGQGLSIVARAAESGEMAGALLVEDFATEPPAGMEGLSPKALPIFEMLGSLDAEYRAGRTQRRGESAHLYLLGVTERFAGRGLAQQMVRRCLDNATQRGYRVAVAEATSRRSQHIFRKLGFTERVWGSYRDFRFEGRACFAAFADEGGPILMERMLSL